MSNVLSEEKRQQVIALGRLGWPLRRIEQETAFIVSMSPPGYPSAWLRPRSARFRFARQDHCSSVA